MASTLPKDTGAVIGINVQRFKDSIAWAKLEPLMKAQAGGEMDEIKTKCGIDPMTAIEQVVVAPDSSFSEENTLLLVSGNFEEAKVNECLQKMAKEKENVDLQVEKKGALTVYKEAGKDDAAYAAWLGKGSVLVSPGSRDGAFLEKVLGGKEKLSANKDLAALLDKVNKGATLWGAGTIPEGGADGMPFEQKPKAAYGSVDLTKALDAKIGLVFADEAAAKAAVTQLQGELDKAKAEPMMGQYLKNLKVEASGADAIITLKMSEEEVEQLFGMMMSFLPMMMGGGF